MKVLIVEDEKPMLKALQEIIKKENYEVDGCDNGLDGLDAILTGVYDIVVLDVMLPGKSGTDVAREARKAGIKTPIIMLTAMSELDDKVKGLDSGADDYLTKPFETRELLARLRALGRRNLNTEDMTLSAGDIKLDPATSLLTCTSSGQSVRLSEKELHIIEYLISNFGIIVSREQIALKIWGFENDSEYNNVEVYISFTRKKLSFIKSKMEIKAVRGLGYQLREVAK